MAAFSHQHSSLLLDSFVEPSTSNYLSSLLLEQDTTHPTYFSPICPSYCLQEIPVHASFHETSSLGCTIHPNNNEVPFTCTTHPCLNEEQGKDLSSTMVVEPKTGDQLVTKVVTPMVKKRSENKIVSKVARSEGKGKKRKISDAMLKNREEKKVKSDKRAKKKVIEEVPTGYFHVRARRGQATDSHSLAERIRREKIGEKMKLLQSLVPGCGKVTGKTRILDEIINHVQFLQNQVEFLVAKLASVSPMLSEFEFDLETYTFESEKLCTLEPHHLASVLQSSSTQLSPLAEPTPDSTSFLTQQDLRFNFTSLDIGIPPCYMMNDERLIKFVNQYGFNYLCPNFQ